MSWKGVLETQHRDTRRGAQPAAGPCPVLVVAGGGRCTDCVGSGLVARWALHTTGLGFLLESCHPMGAPGCALLS